MSTVTRRTALAALAAAAVATAGSAAASVPRPEARRLLLVDDTLPPGSSPPPSLRSASGPALVLGPELVRQWRDGLGAALAAAGTQATALVRWDKALLLQGLARESGLAVRTSRLDRSTFRIDLSA